MAEPTQQPISSYGLVGDMRTPRSRSPPSTPFATAPRPTRFMRFVKRVCRHEGGGHLQIMYGLDGRRDPVERQLDHLAGTTSSAT
jgi:hypothetical protein